MSEGQKEQANFELTPEGKCVSVSSKAGARDSNNNNDGVKLDSKNALKKMLTR